MIKINGQEFENLGFMVNDTTAVLTIPKTITVEQLEKLVKDAEGVFYIDDSQYIGYPELVSIQKLYNAQIGDVQEVYSITLATNTTVGEVLTGDTVSISQAYQMRDEIETMAKLLPEDTGDDYAWVFPKWEVGKAYIVGDRVSYLNLLYKCVQAHTSQADWTPDVAVSLWARTSDPTIEWPEWIQPTGAHDAYAKGDKVSHNDKHWISDVDANVWEPGVYGWVEQE